MTRVLKNAGRCPSRIFRFLLKRRQGVAVGSAADFSLCRSLFFELPVSSVVFFLSRFVMSAGLALTRAFAAVSRL